MIYKSYFIKPFNCNCNIYESTEFGKPNATRKIDSFLQTIYYIYMKILYITTIGFKYENN